MENHPKARGLETALEQALKEAVDDDTYRKVKRMSYSGNAASEVCFDLHPCRECKVILQLCNNGR